MAMLLKFDNTSIFAGFSVSYKLNDDKMCKTLLVAEAYRRLTITLESLNLVSMCNILTTLSFYIPGSIEGIKDGDTILISSVPSLQES
tara:strand:+ start:1141 stop:1404 length:264 start_codon:yes stop_codon:yes gene_type:complete